MRAEHACSVRNLREAEDAIAACIVGRACRCRIVKADHAVAMLGVRYTEHAVTAFRAGGRTASHDADASWMTEARDAYAIAHVQAEHAGAVGHLREAHHAAAL